MKLKLINIHSQGDASEEALRFMVVDDCNLGNYAVTDTTYLADGSVSNAWKHFYHFPPQGVRKGDVVFLYVRKGINGARKGTGTQGGRQIMVYDFFWGFDAPILNNGKECIALYYVALGQKQNKR